MRYLPRSKSHDDGGCSDISSPGTVRGRIARQAGRISNYSRSPSTSPVREHVPMTPLEVYSYPTVGEQTYVLKCCESNESIDDNENVALLGQTGGIIEGESPEHSPLVGENEVEDTCV